MSHHTNCNPPTKNNENLWPYFPWSFSLIFRATCHRFVWKFATKGAIFVEVWQVQTSSHPTFWEFSAFDCQGIFLIHSCCRSGRFVGFHKNSCWNFHRKNKRPTKHTISCDSSRIPRRFSETMTFQKGLSLFVAQIIRQVLEVACDFHFDLDLFIQRVCLGHRMAGGSMSTWAAFRLTDISRPSPISNPTTTPCAQKTVNPLMFQDALPAFCCMYFSPSTVTSISHPLKPTFTTIRHSIFMFSWNNHRYRGDRHRPGIRQKIWSEVTCRDREGGGPTCQHGISFSEGRPLEMNVW